MLTQLFKLSTKRWNQKSQSALSFEPDPTILTATLRKRYRNTEKIQKLTKFVGDTLGNYLKTDELCVPCFTGNTPTWIDLGNLLFRVRINSYLNYKMIYEQKICSVHVD